MAVIPGSWGHVLCELSADLNETSPLREQASALAPRARDHSHRTCPHTSWRHCHQHGHFKSNCPITSNPMREQASALQPPLPAPLRGWLTDQSHKTFVATLPVNIPQNGHARRAESVREGEFTREIAKVPLTLGVRCWMKCFHVSSHAVGGSGTRP